MRKLPRDERLGEDLLRSPRNCKSNCAGADAAASPVGESPANRHGHGGGFPASVQ